MYGLGDWIGEEPEEDRIRVLPTSVIDIAPQKKRTTNHNSTSSRAEYSPFPTEVSDICYQYFLRDSELIFDPFAGWGDRAEKAKQWKKKYIGYDISEESIEEARRRGFENYLADSRTASIPKHDGVLTCPPYWNLEKYSSPEGLDHHKTWEEFLTDYEMVWKNVFSKSRPNTTYCIMVGEWRKNHQFYDLEYETRRIFKELGAVIFDQVVVSRSKVSKIKIMLPQAKRLGYTVRVHESLLIFKKS
jgi:DNA modification methylase